MPAPLTDKWIEEQLKLCDAASQPPWHDGFDDGSGQIDDDDHSGAYITFGKFNHLGLPQCVVDGGDYEGIPKGVLKQEDVDFIIAAREGYTKVLLALRSLRKEVVQCPCCTVYYVEARGKGGLCPECNRMQGVYNG